MALDNQLHKTVLLKEAVNAWLTDNNGIYIDGTFGRGGHTRRLLSKLSDKGRVFGFDKDNEAIRVGEMLSEEDRRFHIYHDSFTGMSCHFEPGSVDGILMDLGVSSPQLDEAHRGFSFMHDGPLDMRMDCQAGESAAQWLARAEEQVISKVLWEFGEERFSRRIARAIIVAREQTPIVTTAQLAGIIASACPVKEKHKHPATRSFQAIRIYINRELEDLSDGLNAAIELLKPGGHLVVISFHSLEDRIAKRFIRKHVKGDELPRWLPVTEEQMHRRLKNVGKAVRASVEEIVANSRSRSAIMRVAQKL
ncbi:Ribosomal RNA small subunit methyltransferase H [invertebrate metagenome]|uniref:Ribosomal RNA small subunit methyltransferase H n=1 Tax=invertebrate metagenome TaxID=1711999 RepID=A0A2H9TAX0_9ZZZZ